jgi:hypothetical protein
MITSTNNQAQSIQTNKAGIIGYMGRHKVEMIQGAMAIAGIGAVGVLGFLASGSILPLIVCCGIASLGMAGGAAYVIQQGCRELTDAKKKQEVIEAAARRAAEEERLASLAAPTKDPLVQTKTALNEKPSRLISLNSTVLGIVAVAASLMILPMRLATGSI